jgi:RNA polymerase sigma-32 factor
MSFHARGFGRNALPLGAFPSLAAMAEISRRTPLLSAPDEIRLFASWRDDGDATALDAIVRAHMRLVLSRAARYRNYGLSMEDMVMEGYVGLVEGLKRFDPGRGFRVSTYVNWWIEASLKQFVITNWSLVKVGTSSDQKKLFFGLRSLKAKLGALGDGDLDPQSLATIATRFGVAEREVVDMNRRLSGSDSSLNVPVGGDGDGKDWMDMLPDGAESIEANHAERDEDEKRGRILREALASLQDREKHILVSRRLSDVPPKLEELAGVYGVSRERIRQIETRALEKLTASMRSLCLVRGLEPPRALAA